MFHHFLLQKDLCVWMRSNLPCASLGTDELICQSPLCKVQLVNLDFGLDLGIFLCSSQWMSFISVWLHGNIHRKAQSCSQIYSGVIMEHLNMCFRFTGTEICKCQTWIIYRGNTFGRGWWLKCDEGRIKRRVMTNWKSQREGTVEEGQQQEHMITENKSSIT